MAHRKSRSVVVLAASALAVAAAALFWETTQSGEGGTARRIEHRYHPDPAYYTEKYRPQYHLSPETANMSDPNGMVYFEGEYHQMYQRSGQWGHAISKDLVHWEHRPLALPRDELGDIWSGSAVVDWRDTSGFFGGKPGLVAVFTHFKDGVQSQSIAYSADRGRTWTKYDGNPVIPNPGQKDFRDPKVFWHEPTRRWVMVVSVDQKVWFYRSPNLREWEWTGEFGWGHGSHAAVWECPDLFELPVEGTNETKWVLTVSIGNNAATKGSKAQYFIGRFDGTTFTNDNLPADVLWTDHGKDFYAAITYSDIPKEDGRRIWLGWMSNWRYPFAQPTGKWKGNLSIPRALSLRDIPGEGVRLVQTPIRELEALRGRPVTVKRRTIAAGGPNPLDGVRGNSFELELEWSPKTGHPFGVAFLKGGGQETKLTYDPAAQQLVLDRTNAGVSGFEANFAEAMTAPAKLKDGRIKLRLFVDKTTVEVFANDGEAVLSAIVFPEPTSDGLELFAADGEAVLHRAAFYPMRTIWRDEDPDGKTPLRLWVSPGIVHVEPGETAALAAAIEPAGANQAVRAYSSDEKVAVVRRNEDGSYAVEGVREGKAQITVTDEAGKLSRNVNVFVGDFLRPAR
ncbi:GH32 C-terminal domain-containing protein [Paenibacillus sp.]|uniref:GH32 C-terminal domain-containing protein n=1 Tax=Paenibacillus sp. TaxID=58172 RepID=UPI002D354718|nr:GH32 C-terminal domain-containing protein [Paenibacillus sp.]HZG85823.1 GH32 C-terminal domain-containing protein [Paenibacillus sp.]